MLNLRDAMKRNRSVLIAIGLSTTLAWGCTEPACTGDWCGTAVVGVAGDAGSLFPPALDSQIEMAIGDLVFSKLADVGAELNTIGDSGFVPQLATAWSWDNPRTIRFTLDPDARWHDGAPVTAADVVFSFDVYRDTLVSSIAAPRLSRVRRVTAIDEHTVTIEFTRPYAEMLFDAVYHVRVVPRHLLDSVPRGELRTHAFGRRPVGSGPYRMVRWRASEYVELEADAAHFQGPPGVPRAIFRFHTDPATLVPQLLAEAIDFVEFLGSPANVERVRAAEHVNVIEYPSLAYVYIAFNLRDRGELSRPHPLFGDRALRRALAMAVDRATAVQAVYGRYGMLIPAPITRAYSVWSDTLPGLSYDSAAARQELTRLGWVDRDGDGVRERAGRRLSFELSVPSSSGGRVRLAQVVQEQLRHLGVEVAITPFDFETTFQRARQGQFDAVFGSYNGDPSPVSIAEVWSERAIGGFNYGRYVSPELERLIDRARNAATPEAARPLWQGVLGTIAQDAPAIFLLEPVMAAGIHERFENAILRGDQWSARFRKWRIPPELMIARDRYGPN